MYTKIPLKYIVLLKTIILQEKQVICLIYFFTQNNNFIHVGHLGKMEIFFHLALN